jgi:transposase
MATQRSFAAKVVLEATGNYGLDLALALHRAKRVQVMVASPRAIAHFALAYLRRSKTDAMDATVARIAEAPHVGSMATTVTDPDVRRRPVQRFPYHVVYMCESLPACHS